MQRGPRRKGHPQLSSIDHGWCEKNIPVGTHKISIFFLQLFSSKLFRGIKLIWVCPDYVCRKNSKTDFESSGVLFVECPATCQGFKAAKRFFPRTFPEQRQIQDRTLSTSSLFIVQFQKCNMLQLPLSLVQSDNDTKAFIFVTFLSPCSISINN